MPAKLVVMVGPDRFHMEVARLNDVQHPHEIRSEHFVGRVLVRILDAPGAHPGDMGFEYFRDRSRRFAIQIEGRFTRPWSGSDLIFGTDLDFPIHFPRRPFNAGMAVAKMIDPCVYYEEHPPSGRPFIMSPYCAAVNTFCAWPVPARAHDAAVVLHAAPGSTPAGAVSSHHTAAQGTASTTSSRTPSLDLHDRPADVPDPEAEGEEGDVVPLEALDKNPSEAAVSNKKRGWFSFGGGAKEERKPRRYWRFLGFVQDPRVRAYLAAHHTSLEALTHESHRPAGTAHGGRSLSQGNANRSRTSLPAPNKSSASVGAGRATSPSNSSKWQRSGGGVLGEESFDEAEDSPSKTRLLQQLGLGAHEAGGQTPDPVKLLSLSHNDMYRRLSASVGAGKVGEPVSQGNKLYEINEEELDALLMTTAPSTPLQSFEDLPGAHSASSVHLGTGSRDANSGATSAEFGHQQGEPGPRSVASTAASARATASASVPALVSSPAPTTAPTTASATTPITAPAPAPAPATTPATAPAPAPITAPAAKSTPSATDIGPTPAPASASDSSKGQLDTQALPSVQGQAAVAADPNSVASSNNNTTATTTVMPKNGSKHKKRGSRIMRRLSMGHKGGNGEKKQTKSTHDKDLDDRDHSVSTEKGSGLVSEPLNHKSRRSLRRSLDVKWGMRLDSSPLSSISPKVDPEESAGTLQHTSEEHSDELAQILLHDQSRPSQAGNRKSSSAPPAKTTVEVHVKEENAPLCNDPEFSNKDQAKEKENKGSYPGHLLKKMRQHNPWVGDKDPEMPALAPEGGGHSPPDFNLNSSLSSGLPIGLDRALERGKSKKWPKGHKPSHAHGYGPRCSANRRNAGEGQFDVQGQSYENHSFPSSQPLSRHSHDPAHHPTHSHSHHHAHSHPHETEHDHNHDRTHELHRRKHHNHHSSHHDALHAPSTPQPNAYLDFYPQADSPRPSSAHGITAGTNPDSAQAGLKTVANSTARKTSALAQKVSLPGRMIKEGVSSLPVPSLWAGMGQKEGQDQSQGHNFGQKEANTSQPLSQRRLSSNQASPPELNHEQNEQEPVGASTPKRRFSSRLGRRSVSSTGMGASTTSQRPSYSKEAEGLGEATPNVKGVREEPMLPENINAETGASSSADQPEQEGCVTAAPGLAPDPTSSSTQCAAPGSPQVSTPSKESAPDLAPAPITSQSRTLAPHSDPASKSTQGPMLVHPKPRQAPLQLGNQLDEDEDERSERSIRDNTRQTSSLHRTQEPNSSRAHPTEPQNSPEPPESHSQEQVRVDVPPRPNTSAEMHRRNPYFADGADLEPVSSELMRSMQTNEQDKVVIKLANRVPRMFAPTQRPGTHGPLWSGAHRAGGAGADPASLRRAGSIARSPSAPPLSRLGSSSEIAREPAASRYSKDADTGEPVSGAELAPTAESTMEQDHTRPASPSAPTSSSQKLLTQPVHPQQPTQPPKPSVAMRLARESAESWVPTLDSELGPWRFTDPTVDLIEDNTFVLLSKSMSVNERRKYFGSQKHRDDFIYDPDVVYSTAFFSNMMDFNTFDLSIGIVRTNISRFFRGMPVRYTLRAREDENICMATISFQIVEED